MDVATWLRGLGLGQYEKPFCDNDIDGTVLPELTAEDLAAIGVASIGHRRRLLAAIVALRGVGRQSARSTPDRDRGVPRCFSSADGEAERRQLTVMFCDLVGSTAMSTRLDPEDMRDVIGSYHRCVADAVGRLDGFVAKFMGDGVLVYFGYPRAHEDDAERAVRTALALVEAVARIETAEPLQVRIGIATGLVVVGDLVGAGEAQERGVVGETPNLAARLQTLAGPNAILVSAATRRLIGRLFDAVDLGEVELAGFANPIRAWRILAASDAESRFEARHETGLTALVGREEELALLLGRWRQVLEGEGRVILLTGEAGIGKSRLAQEFLERVATEPHLRLRYFCSQHHQDSALYPIMEQLARGAGFSREDTAEVKFDKLGALLARVNAEPEAVGLIADLLSLPTRRCLAIPDFSPQQRKAKIFEALFAQLAGLSAQQPVVVLFEDVHWIDASSLEFLILTIDRVQRLPALVLITGRPEFISPWSGHAQVTTLSLTRLNRRQGSQLVAQITDEKVLPPEILERILERTDGVPLFVEELTKSVVESGVLIDAGDHYTITGHLSPHTIPETLHDSLMARLDRLARVKEIAQIAACIGRDFDYDLLSIVSRLPEEDLRQSLDQLRGAELIVPTGLHNGRGYRFKHALVRDAAYAGLLRSRRAQLHHAIALALEEEYPELVEAQPELVAHHLTEAGLADKAIGHWLKAGRRSAARWANIEAIAHLRRGMAALALVDDGPMRDRSELEFQAALGPCLIATQGPLAATALDTFARARELCERLSNATEYPQVMHWMTVVLASRGELPEAIEAAEASVAVARTRVDRPALVNAARGAAIVLLMMGRFSEALERAEEAIAAFEASSEVERSVARAAGQDAGVASLAVMSWALWMLGYPDTAAARIAEALNRASAIADPHSEAYARYYASILYALRREPAIALQHAERCLVLSAEHGFVWRALARVVAGTSAQLIDPLSTAFEEARVELEEHTRRGYQMGTTVCYLLLCDALLRRDNPAAADPLLAAALETASRNHERIVEAELYRLRSLATLATGQREARAKAQSLLAEALAIARGQSARAFELRACLSLAQIWREEGHRAQAHDLIAPIYSWFNEGLDTPDLKEARALLDRCDNGRPTEVDRDPG